MSGSAIRLDAIDTTQNMYIQRKQGTAPLPAPSGDEPEVQYELIPEVNTGTGLSAQDLTHGTAPLPTPSGDEPEVQYELIKEVNTGLRAQDLTHRDNAGEIPPTSPDILHPGHRDYRMSMIIVGLVFSLLLVLSLTCGVSALVLVLTRSPPCDCPSAIGVLPSATTPPSIQPLETTAETTLAETTTLPEVLVTTETTPPPVLVGGVVTLSDVDLYEECTTSIEQTCDINSAIGACFPEMVPIVLNETESHIQNINCVRIPIPGQDTDESNPLVAFLDFPEPNLATCICVVLDGVFGPRVSTVRCGIRVTRCTRPSNLTVTIN